MSSPTQFPRDFLWGVATSAYQIEGAAAQGGRTPSIWDEFCDRPGAIHDGSSGEVAVDHYHRYREDVALMADLGVAAYRFSISWSRLVRPDGTVNPAGMDFYSRLVDELLAHRIRPWVTLYHWDLPTYLPGGWTSRDTAARFAEYAALAHRGLGDRVPTWTTLNEPWCSAFLGHASGEHAPGRQEPGESLLVAHHLLLAHGLAVQALRAEGAAEVGVTLNFTPVHPADPHREADVDVARRVDGLSNRLFVEPIALGRYPADIVADAGALWPSAAVHEGDLQIISTPIDLLGVNYYSGWAVRAGEHPVTPNPFVTAPTATAASRGLPRTEMDWEVDPQGLRELLGWLHRTYTGPAGIWLAITENGAAYEDGDLVGDTVHDEDRIDYLRDHLLAALDAIGDGVDLRAYLLWSFVDNFEWAHGYAKKFGIARVDADLRRHPKLSARWFARVVRERCIPTEVGRAKMGE